MLRFLKEDRGQVSFEYLLTVVFSILLVAAVTVFALNLSNLSTVAETRILKYKERFFKDVFG